MGIDRALRQARAALRDALTVDQAPLLVNDTAAMQVFAARQELAERVLGLAFCLRIRALSQLGELLKLCEGRDRAGPKGVF